MADMMEIAFEDQMSAQGINHIEKQRADLELGAFSGVQIMFTFDFEMGITFTQYMFILHDGNHLWIGQLTASDPADIEKAHSIITQATPKEVQTTDPTIDEPGDGQ